MHFGVQRLQNTVNKAHYRTFKSSNKQVAIREAFDKIF